MSMIDALYEREQLKMRILADEPKIPAFILNSYHLWAMSQFGDRNPQKIFYGNGGLRDVLGRLLARKSCMAAWRETKKDDQSLRLIEPMATILGHARDIASNLQDYYQCETPYDALLEFQTAGYVNPVTAADLKTLHKRVLEKQCDDREDIPAIPIEIMKRVINGLVDLAGVDRQKVEVIDHVAHPACLGYGGIPKGVILGLTYRYEDPVVGILTNWHEVGHAVYRQSIPYGRMVNGRAMDEGVAFLYEHVIGRGDEFLQYILDSGFAAYGYDLDMLRRHVRRVDRQTVRIETNPMRHVIDIAITDDFERSMINGKIEAEDAEIYWQDLIKPYADILPEDYPFYWDVHQMTGIYGDRACYNPGILAAFQLADHHELDLGNVHAFVTQNISQCDEPHFDKAIKKITGKPLSMIAFYNWSNSFYS